MLELELPNPDSLYKLWLAVLIGFPLLFALLYRLTAIGLVNNNKSSFRDKAKERREYDEL